MELLTVLNPANSLQGALKRSLSMLTAVVRFSCTRRMTRSPRARWSQRLHSRREWRA